MMRHSATVLALLLLAALAHGEPPAAEDGAAEKLGYAIGFQVGGDFQRSGRPLDPEALLAGVRDALAGTQPRWTAAEMRQALRRLEESQGTAREKPGTEPLVP